MKNLDAATILMTNRVMEIASKLCLKEMKEKEIRYDSPEYESARSEKYVSEAAKLFVIEVKMVQKAMEGLIE